MYIDDLPLVMLKCLTTTVIIEVIIALIIGIRKKDILSVIIINIITNPLIVSLSVYFGFNYGIKAEKIATLVLEIIVFITEGILYNKFLEYKKINGFIISLIFNGGSYLIGKLISYIIYLNSSLIF